MTENMAARGEGLKELVARLVVMRDGADADARLAEEDSIQQWEAIGKSFAFNESAKQLAALEAAAPPSTAQLEHWEQLFYEAFCEDRDADMNADPLTLGERCKKYAALAAALATPSPQASVERERLIAKWDAYTKGMRAGMSKLSEESMELASHRIEMAERFIADLNEDYPGQAYVHAHNPNIKRAEENAKFVAGLKAQDPAATQEPAGSGAQVVADLQIALRIVGDWKEDSRGLVHVHKDAIRKAIVAALRSAGNCGSPRKVGEDGAQTFEQWWQAEGARMVRTTHCTGYELMKEAWNAALPRAKEQQKELRVKSHTPSVSVL